jgi:hypothetical protein
VNLVAFWAILARRVNHRRCGRQASVMSTIWPAPGGNGCGGTCIPSACSAWRWTPAGT